MFAFVFACSFCFGMSQPPAIPSGAEIKIITGEVVSDELKMQMAAQIIGITDDKGENTKIYMFSNTDVSNLSRLRDMGGVIKGHRVETTYYVTSDGLNAATMMRDVK